MDQDTREAKDRAEQKIFNDVKTYGWSIMNVFDPDQKEPNFSYSIGMYKTLGTPEIIVFGMDQADAGNLINKIGESVRSGNRLEPKTSHHEFLDEGWACSFANVDKKHYPTHLGFDLWFYESSDFPVLQCVWADEKGHFPWDTTFNPQIKRLQPLLD